MVFTEYQVGRAVESFFNDRNSMVARALRASGITAKALQQAIVAQLIADQKATADLLRGKTPDFVDRW